MSRAGGRGHFRASGLSARGPADGAATTPAGLAGGIVLLCDATLIPFALGLGRLRLVSGVLLRRFLCGVTGSVLCGLGCGTRITLGGHAADGATKKNAGHKAKSSE